MLYEDIKKCLNDCDEHIQDGGQIVTNTLLKPYKEIPDNIKKLIKNDYKVVSKIIDYYYTNFCLVCNSCETLDQALESVIFIQNKTNARKTIYIEFNEEIIDWLKSTDFFINIYENYSPNIINSSDIINSSTTNTGSIKFRENQVLAFNNLEKNGIETGIHCQATGCGKTFIIIRYIDYIYRINKNPKVILFTERISILSDLFLFTNKQLQVDKNKLNIWKELGVGDLTGYEIVNRVTNKTHDWCDVLKNSTRPCLVVINRSFLTHRNKYNMLSKGDLHLVIHDECHNTSSVECQKFLLKCKSIDCNIVGFSATPLRTGKDDKEKLLEIYSKPTDTNELNLLTNYNMIYAIDKNLILPPEFHWYQLETTRSHSTVNKITPEELGTVFEILNNIIETLPNKKIIAWCGTIDLAYMWKEQLEKYSKDRKNFRTIIFGIDTSKEYSKDYEYFSKCPRDTNNNIIPLDELNEEKNKDSPYYKYCRMYYGKSILFCANKHREGSDIPLLDACIFLDKVKERGAIPFIQSIGRTLRICPDTPSKTKGVIIDGFMKDENYEKDFVNKIIEYYLALENLCNISNNDNKLTRYVELRDKIQFDKERKTVHLKIGSKDGIKIHCNRLEWKNIIKNFDKILQDKIKLTEDETFRYYIEELKKLKQFRDPSCDFRAEYEKLDHIKLGLPKDIYKDYEEIWNVFNWYTLLGFSYPKFKFFKEFVTLNNITSNKELHKILSSTNNTEFPYYPKEYYRLEGWTGWKTINNSTNIY